MIKSFKDVETEGIFQRKRSRKLPPEIQQIALRKLHMIHNAQTLNDLRIPPANRLEKLKGNRAGQYSVRINNQWRICLSGVSRMHMMWKSLIILGKDGIKNGK